MSQNGFIFPKWMRKKKYLKTSTQYTFPSPLEGQTSSHRAEKQAKEQRAPRWRFFQMDLSVPNEGPKFGSLDGEKKKRPSDVPETETNSKSP